ncbi:hypothetical protein R6Q57_017508 [Mikania cordata]
MALLISNSFNGVESVPKDYVMPPERRAEDFVTVCNEIPVINHGVPDKMMKDMMALYDEFFNLPVEDKLGVYAEKPRKGEEVGRYMIEVRKMGFKILDLIAIALDLREEYFNEVSQEHTMAINHYPPCPDPS